MEGNAIVYAILFIFGLAFGSFLNVLIYRFSKGQNLKEIFSGRSYCPNCKTTIRWYDNIPLISYLVLRGRCRNCGWKIPLRYPIVELLGGIIPVLIYWQFGSYGWITVISYTLLGYILFVLAFVDWYTFTVPDTLSVGGTLLGLMLSFFRKDITPLESFLAALLGALIVVVLIFLYYKIRGVVPFGLGDAKVLALVGSFGGFTAVYCSLFLGSLIGILFFLPQIVKNRSLQFTVPFVPFLALGAFIGIFCKKFLGLFLF